MLLIFNFFKSALLLKTEQIFSIHSFIWIMTDMLVDLNNNNKNNLSTLFPITNGEKCVSVFHLNVLIYCSH